MRINALAFIRRMQGGAQSQLMLGDDGQMWLVKFQNNPQHIRILANEFIATNLAAAIGLTVPPMAVITVSEELTTNCKQLYIQHGASQRSQCSPGCQCGSYYISSSEYTQDEEEPHFPNIVNGREFAGILCLDKWLCNHDSRQVVCRRSHHSMMYEAFFVDQGFCLAGATWDFSDLPLRGLYRTNKPYEQITGWQDFEPWLSRLEQLAPSTLWDIAAMVPREWYGRDLFRLEAMVDRLVQRQRIVRNLISEVRLSSRQPFPYW